MTGRASFAIPIGMFGVNSIITFDKSELPDREERLRSITKVVAIADATVFS